MKTLRLLTCDSSQEAALIKGNLENHGIKCFITNDNFTTLVPYFNGMLGAGIQVLVFEEDYEHALEIIKPGDSSAITCPHCGSTNIKYGLGRYKNIKLFAVVISLLATIPFGNIKLTYNCRSCRKDFKR